MVGFQSHRPASMGWATPVRVGALLALGLTAYSYAQVAGSAVPRLLPYQGSLAQNGAPVTGPVDLSFSLYDSPTGGALLWGPETHSGVLASRGRVSVVLGAITPISDSVWDSADRYIAVSVAGQQLTGRQRILSAPNAIQAARAEAARGGLRSELDSVGSRLSGLEGRVVLTGPGGQQTSVDGKYCGATAATTGAITAQGGTLFGYRAAKRLCEQTCSAATAHMCTGLEAIQSHELGIALPNLGWVKAGPGVLASQGGSLFQQFDCGGWGIGSSPGPGGYLYLGAEWDGQSSPSTPFVTGDYCNFSRPVLCCN